MRLSDAVKALEDAGIDSAKYDARELFRVFGKLKGYELLSPNASSDEESLRRAVERRCAREPLQYIIGEVDFYRESYEVNPSCLIPRQDTEILVELAVKMMPEGAYFLDLCTGSGCIAISVLKNTENTTAAAVDISDEALKIAERNAEKNGVSDRISFRKADILKEKLDGNFFAVLSNPPYVTSKAYENLEPEIYKEPKIAFVGGDDGTVFYEKIVEVYKSSLSDDGFFAFEIGYDQAKALKKIAETNGLFVKIIKDYSGNDRVALLKKQSI